MEGGTIVGLGWNEHGQLGHMQRHNQSGFEPIALPNQLAKADANRLRGVGKQTVCAVSCGHSHTVVLMQARGGKVERGTKRPKKGADGGDGIVMVTGRNGITMRWSSVVLILVFLFHFPLSFFKVNPRVFFC
jgi:hypothetical protein